MNSNRLEAFSDGVLAIIITIMVLELKVPEGDTLASLQPLIPTFTTYVLSFIYLGIYWNNHHHLMHATEKINGVVLWANLHLLFWLSLFPFATGYMGENHFEPLPTALYGFVLFMASIAWNILLFTLRQHHEQGSLMHQAYVATRKSFLSPILYAIGTVLSFFQPIVAVFIYLVVAVIWFIPSKKVETMPPTI